MLSEVRPVLVSLSGMAPAYTIPSQAASSPPAPCVGNDGSTGQGVFEQHVAPYLQRLTGRERAVFERAIIPFVQQGNSSSACRVLSEVAYAAQVGEADIQRVVAKLPFLTIVS